MKLEAIKATRPEVRLATEGDSEKIAEVVQRAFGVYRDNYTPEALSVVTPGPEEFTRRLTIGPQWVAEMDGEIVGTVSVTVEEGDLYVKTMAVDPQFQGRGIAHLLLDAIDEYAATTTRTRIFLYTTYFSAGAKELYEKHGYTWVRDTPAEEWYGVPGLEMEKFYVT
jgi:mycothiol synthase